MHRPSFLLVLCLSFCAVLLVGGCGNGTLQEAEHDPFAGFLSAFTDATAELDVERMSGLFLLPDETVDGIHRKAHLDEILKDWSRARAQGETNAVKMAEIKYLIRATMSLGDEVPGERERVEFEVVPTTDGWKIARMDYIN